MAVALEIPSTVPVPRAPEVEDHLFDPSKLRALGPVPATAFWDLLATGARPQLAEIFGGDLTRRGDTSCGVDPGRGAASLGCLSLSRPPRFYLRRRADRPPQLRMFVSDGEFELDLSVTDIRLHADDHVTPDPAKVRDVTSRLARGVPAILSVGLTRAFAPSPDSLPVHWLQVNNIHLRDDPVWQPA